MFFVRFTRSPSSSVRVEEVGKSTEDQGEDGAREGDDEPEGSKKKEGDEGEADDEGAGKKKLEESIKAYIKARKFRFVHHFAGPRDPLGAEIHRIAKKRGMTVEVISVEKDWGQDLCADEPFNTHLGWAKEGLIDGYHSGFPCSTFSRLRFREAEGLPPPVRTRAEPYGCKSNSERQQAECDKGTVMMARSAQMAEEVARSATSSIVIKPTTLENPPPSERSDHVSAWGMSEVVAYLRCPGVKVTQFNTCAYQAERARGDRHWKLQQFAGTLFGIEQLSRECKCGSAKHKAIIGKRASQESGEYPWELCNEYAKLLMDHFEKMATAEYLEGRMKELDQFHDGLSTGDAEATKMRELRKKEGVKISPSSEPERKRKERDHDRGRHEGKFRKGTKGRTRAQLRRRRKTNNERKGKKEGGRGQDPRDSEGRKDPPRQGGGQETRGERKTRRRRKT